jgi:hypothetical protein
MYMKVSNGEKYIRKEGYKDSNRDKPDEERDED